MKKLTPYLLLVAAVMISLLQGCTDKCEKFHQYVYMEPVYTTTEEIRAQFEYQESRAMENPGKLYIYGAYLLINEVGKGIHVFNNLDKSNPVNLGFINIPGNFDLSVKENVLYADSYVDLLAIDITNINDIHLIKRLDGVFNMNYNVAGLMIDESTVITEWVEKEVVEISENCNEIREDFFPWRGGFLFSASTDMSAFSAAPAPSVGVGGSMARFTINADHLYAVDWSLLYVFDILDPKNPVERNNLELGWGIETIFPYKENLFIGANNGMHIYNVSDPSQPRHLSTFSHVTSCDPVVVNDEYAFVTLRDGTNCGGFTNQLDVIDITNLENPKLIKSYPMDNPHGLGLDGNTLFLCEGVFGLKVFDVENVNTISENRIAYFEGMHALDVIPWQNTLLMIGADGFYQYDYSSLEDIRLLSVIPVIKSEDQ